MADAHVADTYSLHYSHSVTHIQDTYISAGGQSILLSKRGSTFRNRYIELTPLAHSLLTVTTLDNLSSGVVFRPYALSQSSSITPSIAPPIAPPTAPSLTQIINVPSASGA